MNEQMLIGLANDIRYVVRDIKSLGEGFDNATNQDPLALALLFREAGITEPIDSITSMAEKLLDISYRLRIHCVKNQDGWTYWDSIYPSIYGVDVGYNDADLTRVSEFVRPLFPHLHYGELYSRALVFQTQCAITEWENPLDHIRASDFIPYVADILRQKNAVQSLNFTDFDNLYDPFWAYIEDDDTVMPDGVNIAEEICSNVDLQTRIYNLLATYICLLMVIHVREA